MTKALKKCPFCKNKGEIATGKIRDTRHDGWQLLEDKTTLLNPVIYYPGRLTREGEIGGFFMSNGDTFKDVDEWIDKLALEGAQEDADDLRKMCVIGKPTKLKRPGVLRSAADTIESLLAIISKKSRESLTWQPIETAPKDESFLAFEDGSYYRCQVYEEYEGEISYSSDCGQQVTEPPEPTHWMPLPDKPE